MTSQDDILHLPTPAIKGTRMMTATPLEKAVLRSKQLALVTSYYSEGHWQLKV